MKRTLIHKLLEWKQATQKKPILLTGTRGVGKTYLAFDFAKAYYGESIYINFEREPYLYNIFSINDSSSIRDSLNTYFHLSESSNPILLILDEISACSNILNVIDMVSKATDSYHILTISSIFEELYGINDIFIQIQLYPLDFEEFLIATGNNWYIEVIRLHFELNKKLPAIVHQELLTLFEDYLQVGGMPSAVNEFINTETKYNVSEQHRILMNSYLSDVNQHNIDGDALKVRQVFSIIDKQLIKDNHKFQYTLIRKGATYAIYSDALKYIQATFFGILCNKLADVSSNLNPSSLINEMQLVFKLYMPDVGMLYSTIRTSHEAISEQIRKGIMENYVAQSLTSKGYHLNFWESSSQAKIDFIIIKGQQIIPIEVKTNDSTRSKNISVFKTKCSHMTDSIKISTKNFEYSNNVKYVPIYAVFCI